METKNNGSIAAGLLGLLASLRLLWLDSSLVPYVGTTLKLLSTLLIVFLSVLVNKFATDLYANKIKPKIFKNAKPKKEADEDRVA